MSDSGEVPLTESETVLMTPEELAAYLEQLVREGKYDPDCMYCDHDAHRCPGCGVSTNHLDKVCPECRLM